MGKRPEIVIADNEIPERIRGPYKGYTTLTDGTMIVIGGHSGTVADVIEGVVRRSGAKTKSEVLKCIEELAESSPKMETSAS